MAIDLTALSDELANDPEGLGYTGDDVGDADLLNEVRSTIRLDRDSIPMGEVYGQVDWDDEWVGLSNIKREAFRQITSTENLDVTSVHIREALVTIFGSGSATISNLQDILKRDASRAEVLFGRGVSVTPSDCADARRV